MFLSQELEDNEEVKQVIFKDLASMFNLSIQQFAAFNYPESNLVQTLINHPVHIYIYMILFQCITMDNR